tara:strand:+ start:818 stop:3046 length:2229 start_codon:yes stop_codon:yes gene_type:complete
MNKRPLKYFFVKILFILTFLLGAKTALYSSENKFCLEDDGFITPIINSETICKEIITVSEFKHLINISHDKRSKSLKEFRILAEKKPIKEKELSKEEVKKASKEIIKKSTLEQKRLKRLADAKQKRIENQKKLLEKRLQAKKINEEKRFKRLQDLEKKKQEKIKKKLEAKKVKDRKLKEKREKIAAAKLERENRLKARKEKLAIAKQKRLEKSNESKVTAKKDYEEENNKKNENIKIEISTDLKIINLKKEIVKKEMFPLINKDIEKWKEKDFSYEVVQNMNVKSLKELTKSEKNLIVLIPKDFDAFANNVSQNQMMSKVVSGLRQVPNPEFTRLEAEIRDKERRAIMAKREAENFEARLNNPYRQSSGIGWLDILAVAADTGGAIKYWDNYRNLQDQVSSLVNDYSNTPMTIDKKMYSSYTYLVNNIKAEKKVSYNILFFQNDSFMSKSFEIKEIKDFKIASGLNPQDENFNSLNKKYDSENELNVWNTKKINDQKISGLLVQLLNENSTAQKISNKDAFKMLDSSFVEEKEKSFWGSLFSSNKKKREKKVASIPKNNDYEILDSRFESVVVVKTGSGLGSGFYVKDNEIITNYHVIENANNITVIDKDKKRSSAIVIKKDLKRDLALLKTNAKGKKVSFFNGAIKQGSKVEALGHPRGKKFSISQGIVSAIRNESSVYNVSGTDNVLFIQTDAAINKGNSGGPLFLGGKVVGVNTQGLSKKTSEGMNFAVHFSEVQQFLK